MSIFMHMYIPCDIWTVCCIIIFVALQLQVLKVYAILIAQLNKKCIIG